MKRPNALELLLVLLHFSKVEVEVEVEAGQFGMVKLK